MPLSRITLAENTTRNRNLPAGASDCGTLCACAALWEIDGQHPLVADHQHHYVQNQTFKGQDWHVCDSSFGHGERRFPAMLVVGAELSYFCYGGTANSEGHPLLYTMFPASAPSLDTILLAT